MSTPRPRKLLLRTLRAQLAYAGLVLVAGTFLFYYVLRQLYYTDVDEALVLRREEVVKKLPLVPAPADLALWMRLDRDLEIRPLGAERAAPERIIGELRYDSLAHEMEPYRTLLTTVAYQGQPYRLVLRSSLVEDEDLLAAIGLAQAGLLVVLLGGLVLVQQRVARRLWRPFYVTLAQLRRFRLDQRTPVALAVSLVQEFGELNEALTELLSKHRRIFLSQKEFTENAAHEMQTPLAVQHTKLELLAQSPDLTEAQARHLDALVAVTQRLARLNRSLLLLARLENHQFAADEAVALRPVVESIADQLAEQAEAAGLRVELALTAPGEVRANQALLEILVSNLLSNAIRHNVAGGTIRVRLTDAELLVENTGRPVALPVGQEFARFRKDALSAPGGVGLGLAIERQVCDTCGLGLAYAFFAPNWHRFTVQLG
ncbi:ATP-binding protein [Hymenobacter sp. DH14]|jgi:two-component system sensor histidine kinase QseC|uniref:histidine kinase n=1 Tax=Hymenobacter cyanobacteriorum TaxID=2926463 RepID=A0A9X1VKJ6_9BACT|nr:ATP-binding protein [Hymenobacter cyanobacteriorum]MCI1189918.1 ATP-binding protein [Hymenobacter cyanobacteriorum]